MGLREVALIVYGEELRQTEMAENARQDQWREAVTQVFGRRFGVAPEKMDPTTDRVVLDGIEFWCGRVDGRWYVCLAEQLNWPRYARPDITTLGALGAALMASEPAPEPPPPYAPPSAEVSLAALVNELKVISLVLSSVLQQKGDS
jgi:hypothetical protein